jgi:drug/metabolite transporter (DMT)-like permease
MLSKRKEQQISPHLLTAVAHFVGGILLLISSFIFEKPQSYNFPTEFWGALLWLAVISSAGFSIWYGLLNRPEVKVSELNMWKFLIPVFGTALSWLLVKNESPDYPTILGIVVITAALLLMQLPESFFRRGKL